MADKDTLTRNAGFSYLAPNPRDHKDAGDLAHRAGVEVIAHQSTPTGVSITDSEHNTVVHTNSPGHGEHYRAHFANGKNIEGDEAKRLFNEANGKFGLLVSSGITDFLQSDKHFMSSSVSNVELSNLSPMAQAAHSLEKPQKGK